MDFETCFNTSSAILMEGAIGERLRREHNIRFDDNLALASLIYNTDAKRAMKEIFMEYISIAERYNLPFIMTTPTRRANREGVTKSNFNERIIEDNVRFLKELRGNTSAEVFVGGLMGCAGDAYKATNVLSIEDAYGFHSWQANLFRAAGVDLLFAGIMPALSEAVGMAKAMESTGLPYIISFMIRNNGKLIDGTTIHNAISIIDKATTRKPVCYMANCVHPIVLKNALSCLFNNTETVRGRFLGIQANASPLSPEELDMSCELKTSDSVDLASHMMELYRYFTPKIMGGCCGTDDTHMEEIAKSIKNSFLDTTLL